MKSPMGQAWRWRRRLRQRHGVILLDERIQAAQRDQGAQAKGEAGDAAKRRPRRLRINGSRLVIVLTLIYVVITAINQQFVLSRLAEQKSLLQLEIDRMQAEIERLEERAQYLSSEAYVIQDARSRFGLVRPGEILYLTREEDE